MTALPQSAQQPAVVVSRSVAEIMVLDPPILSDRSERVTLLGASEQRSQPETAAPRKKKWRSLPMLQLTLQLPNPSVQPDNHSL
jgi:hypothetical protein